MQNLKTVDLPFGKKTKWFITHVDVSTGHIYCQLSEPSISVKYERLYQDIHAWSEAGKLQERILNPYIGEFCLSEYAADKSWYRSQIAEVDDSLKQAEVFFIDHGNSEVLSFEAIRKLPSAFAELPAQAYECILANVEPILKTDKWSDKAIELIKELVLDQELDGIPIRLSKNLLVLKLFADKDSTVTVAEQLVSAGFGQTKLSSISSGSCTSLPRTNSLSSIDSASSRRSSSSTVSSIPKTIESFKKFTLQKEQYADLCVVFSEGIDNFYCHPISHKNELEILQESLQKFYSQSQPSLPKLSKDLPCCAKYPEDDLWYRAVIKSTSVGSSSSVFFVDFGNSDEVPNSSIKTLDSQFFALPAMAIKCKLSDAAPLSNNKFSDEANERFESLTMDFESIVAYVTKINDNKSEIVLIDKDDNPVTDQLVKEGLVSSHKKQEISKGNDTTNPSTVSSTVDKKTLQISMKYVMPSVYPGLQEKVYICFSVNPHHFYVNLSCTSDGLHQLMSQISNVYQCFDTNIGSSAPVGYPCIARFTEDEQYYRAEVLECNGDKVKVQFVDYGNTEETNISELKSLQKEFIKLPKQGIACKLIGVEPLSGSFLADACQKFEEIAMDKELLMTVRDIQNGYCNIDLLEMGENNQVLLDVAKTLISSGLVKPGKDEKKDFGSKILTETSFEECKVDVESYVDVAPVHIENPSQFCCHVVQNAVEFTKLTEDLNDYYSVCDVDSNVQWKKLMPCVALYDADNCWYRAMITSVSANSLDVTFVDFGNSATLSTANVRPILTNFMKLPAQVFVCSLADIKPKEKSWTPKAIEQFQNLALDQHLAAYVKEKYENNSFSVVLYDTKTSEKNISQLLIEQNNAAPSNNTEIVIGCSRYVEPGTKEDGYITVVENLGEFWIQLSRLSPQLDILMNQMDSYYSQIQPLDLKINSPIIGQYCCSCFTEDDGWYRAYIKEVDGKSLTVEYIDYGNSEHLSIDRVRLLSPDFDGSPRYALPCCLQDFEDFADYPSAKETLLEKEFSVEFKSKVPPFKVELYTEGQALSQTISRQVSNKISTAKEITIEKIPAKNESGDITYSNTVTSFSEKAAINTVYPMYFLEASSPHEFYCQPAESENELATLMDNIAEFVGKGNMKKFKGQAGEFGLAIYKEDEGWYRVQVLEKIKQNFKVLYCDYGNKDIISKDEVYALPSHLSRLEQQAVLCSLSRLQSTSNEWTNGAIEMFNTLCSEKKLEVSVLVKDNLKLNVMLKDPSTGEDLGERLISAGFAKQESPVIEGIKPTTQYKYQSPDFSDKESGFCTSVSSADSIKIQLGKYEDQVNTVMENLAQEAPSCSQLPLINVGDACLAVFSDDGQWYRAEVIKVEGSNATVSFVDYGNTEVCEAKDLKIPTLSMMKLPRTCIECKLHDVHLKDLDVPKVEEYLNTNVLDQALTVEFIGKLDENNLVEGYVYQDGSANHVNNLLYSLFEVGGEENIDVHDEKPKRLQYLQPSLLEKETGFCTGIASADSIKVQLGKYEDEINNLMEKLSQEAASYAQIVSPNVGDACIAVYSEDQQWYRAEVTKVDGCNALVSFVDYGNTEICEAKSLKTPTSSIMELPKTCVECKLHDVHLTDLNVAKVEEYLNTTMIDQKVNLELKSKPDENNTITAYVYQDGSIDHLNDLLYSMFALEEVPEENSSKSVAPEEVLKSFKYLPSSVSEKEIGFCTSVCSANSLKIQLGKYEDQINTVMENLAQEALSCSQLPSINIGDACLAVFSDDGQWYRAEVIKVEGSNATVSFVDYGNTEVCEAKDLKIPTPFMMELPRTCIECKLHDVHLKDLDVPKVEEYLNTNVLDQALTVEAKSELNDCNCLEAYIYQDGVEDHVNDILYSLFEISAEEEPTISAEQGAPVKSSPIESSPTDEASVKQAKSNIGENKIKAPVIANNTSYSAICYVVESATKLQCQMCSFKEQIDDLMNRIAENVSTFQPLNEPVVGVCCIAKYAEDDGWYRGRIQSVVNKDVIRVHFVDFGNTEDVPLSDLREITQEYAALEQTCVSVLLHDVHTEDINVDSTKQWLNGKLLEHVVRLECISYEEDSISAYVYAEGRDEHVNDQVYELFQISDEQGESLSVATTDVDIPLPELANENSYYGFCYIVESANILKCQLQKYTNQLDQLMLKLEELSPTLPQETDIRIGKPCVAKYAQDGGWYRGRISQTMPDVKVDFLDFGNVDSVPVEDIKVLPDDCKTLPQTCVSVIFHDVHLEDIDGDATMKWLTETFLEQSLRLQTVDTSKNPIVEAYVYQEIYSEWAGTHINDHMYALYALADEKTEADAAAMHDDSEEDSGISEGGPFIIDLPKPEANTRETMTCTHMESPVLLKCQLFKYAKDLDQISEQFPAYCNKTSSLEKFDTGSFCLAMFTEDGMWYRAQILKDMDDVVTVEFIDYGNTDTIKKCNTRLLCAEFAAIPRTNVDVHLHGALASEIENKTACMEWLGEQVLDRELRVDIISYESHVVDANVFVEGSETSMNDRLQGYIRENASMDVEENKTNDDGDSTQSDIVDTTSEIIDVKDHTQTSVNNDDTEVTKDLSELQDTSAMSGISPLSETTTEDANRSVFPSPDVRDKEVMLCTYVDSGTKLCFQLLKYEEAYNSITELLAEERVNMSDVFTVEELKLGVGVVAKSVADGDWYRATIVNHVQNEHVKVLYIDFGNTEMLPVQNLRKPLNDLFMYPATCINCKLSNVGNVDEERAKEWLEVNCVDQTFNAEFTKGKNDTKQAVIHFADREDTMSVNQQLQTQFPMQIDSAILKRTAIDGGLAKRKQKINYVKGNEVDTICDRHGYSWMVLKKDSYEKATCCFVESANLLHFQLTRFKAKLEKLMSTIASEAEDLPGVRFLEEGAPCIAQNVDLSWYRGKVLETNTGYASIEFVDYGNKDDVITEDIRVIKRPKMLDEHVYSVRCILSGVDIPEVSQEDAMEYLSKTLSDDAPEVYLKIVDFDTNKLTAEVTIIQNDQDINEFLQTNYAPHLVLRNLAMNLGEKIQVTIPTTESLSLFWCQLYDVNSRLDQLMEHLNNVYSSQNVDFLDKIEVGEPCCIFCDERWYRATVESNKDEAATVFLVDFGIKKSVSLDNIRVLLPEFFLLEQQGFMATLFDLRPYKNAEIWSNDAIACFNNICKEDTLTVTIINYLDGIPLVAVVTSDGDTMYELLTNQNFAETSVKSVDADNLGISNGH